MWGGLTIPAPVSLPLTATQARFKTLDEETNNNWSKLAPATGAALPPRVSTPKLSRILEKRKRMPMELALRRMRGQATKDDDAGNGNQEPHAEFRREQSSEP